MKAFDFIAAPKVYIEIGQSSLKALDGNDGLELSVERLDNGRLDPLCAQRLTDSLRVFLKKHSWRSQIDAVCAISARGVSLRRMTVPSCSKEELQRVMLLQIEREFPLAPEELAWGCRSVTPDSQPRNGGPATQDVLVAAVKREVLDEYSKVLTNAGVTPVFTVAALARAALCANPPQQFAVLDIGPEQSELISIQDGVPAAIRILSFGSKNFSDAAAKSLQPAWIGQKLYITGAKENLDGIVPESERIAHESGEGRSAAILGLQKLCEQEEGALTFQLGTSHKELSARPRVQWQSAAAAVFLIFASLALRYAEPLLNRGRATKKVAELKAYRAKIPNVDREFQLLQYLQTNQPSYLDTIYTLANSAPSGTRLEALSIARPGDISLRATMRDPQQVVDLRNKLVESGLFSTVVVQEQTPSADKQKLAVRMTAQSKANSDQRPRAMPALAPEPEKAKSPAPGPAKDVKAIAATAATGNTATPKSESARTARRSVPTLSTNASGSPAPPPDATVGGTSAASPATPPKE